MRGGVRRANRLGTNSHAQGGELRPLKLPDYTEYAVAMSSPGATDGAATRTLGVYLRDVFARHSDARNFRIVCPDETTSNRLDAVFEQTERPFEWPLVATDEFLSRSGRVMEILSEHTCEGWLEGYLLVLQPQCWSLRRAVSPRVRGCPSPLTIILLLHASACPSSLRRVNESLAEDAHGFAGWTTK